MRVEAQVFDYGARIGIAVTKDGKRKAYRFTLDELLKLRR